jgi:hypothetical protein
MRGPIFILWVIILTLPGSALADAASDAAAIAEFPQLRPRNLLPPLLDALKGQLGDPHSITDFVLCPPIRVSLASHGERRPVKWEVLVSFNAKNAMGGYVGRTMFSALFREGKPPSISKAQMDTDVGLDHFINKAIAKKMADCPSVPDDQLQKFLGISTRPTVDLNQ